MKVKSSLVVILLVITALAGCRRPALDPVPPLPPVTPTFLFSNDDGELRILHVDYTDDLDTLYTIKRFGTLGFTNFEFGKADTRKAATYDWNRFGRNQDPKAAVITWRENLINPNHMRMWERLYVEIGNFERTRNVGFFSELNQRTQPLRQFNYYRGANSVSFLNHRYYLAIYTDRYVASSGVPKPNLPVGDRKSFLLLYDIQAPQPNQPEIIATLYHDDYISRFPETYNWIHNIRGARIAGSPNAHFFFVWSKAFNTSGTSPWVFRFDGTPAFNPLSIGGQAYARYPGQETIGLDVHPVRDSVFVVTDRGGQYAQTMVLRVPPTPNSHFEILAALPFSAHMPENPYVSTSQARPANTWHVRFNQRGNKVAIMTAIAGVEPHITIWDWQNGTHQRFNVNSSSNPYNFDVLGDGGWEVHADNDIFYFMAGDSNQELAFIHYVNASRPNENTARLINWDDISYRDLMRDEPLREVKELKQRKAY